jgi:hypothetical protein
MATQEGAQKDTFPSQQYGWDGSAPKKILVGADGSINVIAGLIPKNYDYIYLDPPSKPTTVTYKNGGSGGTTVATLTIAYSGDDIQSITRS